MNIKIVDSWLREYLKTKASCETIAEKLSLCSVSVEKIEKVAGDLIYDIEVTSNRVDLMSVIGIAREAAASLTQSGIPAEIINLNPKPKTKSKENLPLKIVNDPKLVNRITAVLIEVEIKESPKFIKERLEESGIRSLNNLIDVTNYIMRETGYPAHVFDFDRFHSDKITIREAKRGEKIITLDGKMHVLQGGDIVADNNNGQIVDLLGVMGTANSVVTDKTKRILLFLDNNDPNRIRKTSMNHEIRSEAAIINEKGVDSELIELTLMRGIELYEQVADGKVISEILDIYPNKPKKRSITVTKEKIDKFIGIDIPLKTSVEILEKLDFKTSTKGNLLNAEVPFLRLNDVFIEEDLIEEIARIYGYQRLPSVLPPLNSITSYHMYKNEFFWEQRIKNALKYWGFTECYTYSMISENLFEGPTNDAVEIKNPLSEDMTYLRKTLIPSLLEVAKMNKGREELKIFEIANIYEKKVGDLPRERRMIAGVIKKQNASFFEAKGIAEQLFKDLGLKKIMFKNSEYGGVGSSVYIDESYLGEVELLESNLVNFEFNLEKIIKNASLNKKYKKLAKYPPVIEDLAIIAKEETRTAELIDEIYMQSDLVKEVNLLDQYKNTRTFHIIYQSDEKNLTIEETSKIREKILSSLKKKFEARLKE